MKQKGRITATILGIIGICLFLISIYFFVSQSLETRRAKESLQDFHPSTASPVPPQLTSAPKLTETPAASALPTPTNTPTATPVPLVENPYAKAYAANEDMVGWLVIPDTKIDYPLMWTPGDENYYLYRDFNKRENKNGSLILDTDSSLTPLTTNLIIHGHNMKSGEMFGNLTDYEDPEYFAKHPQIILYTKECARNYEIIAVFRSQVYKKSDQVFKFYQFFQAPTEKEFHDFYGNIKELSLYDTGVDATFGDRFLTLSTCVYHVKNGRFVIVAKEIDPGDYYLPIDES